MRTKFVGQLLTVCMVPLLATASAGCGSDTSTASTSSSSSGGAGDGGMGGEGGEGGGSSSSSGSAGTGGMGGEGGASCIPTTETCNGLDDDCDGVPDNGNPGGGNACQTGLDGVCNAGTETCIQGVFSCVPDVGPGELAETCNTLDDDCDGLADEGLATESWFKDDDSDGFGTQASIQACSQPAGYAPKSGDCNDNNANIYPGAIEICNDGDDNCNGFNDEGVQKPTFFKDNDMDGYGGVSSTLACSAPPGYVAEGGDCNDFNAMIYPNAMEACNDLDDNCNGLIDEGVPTQTIYKDNDGDGFAPMGAQSQEKCNVPIGWALPKDTDGDGNPNWDCNDSDVTVYPAAPTVCDGKDNDCDGIVDRLCFSDCPGTWPAQPALTGAGVSSVSHADLDGNGKHEVIFQSDTAFAILSETGTILHEEGSGALNYSRGQALVADIDNYDQFSPTPQTLEVLTGNQSKLTYYKYSGGVVTKISSNHDIYDASPFMLNDMNGDGIIEFYTTSWCVGTQGTRIFRYDRGTNTINLVTDIADPDNTCEYTDGRMLTDLDGDGTAELIFGNGYAHPQTPNTWMGKIHSKKFTDVATLANTPYCMGCFTTDIPMLYGGGVGSLLRIGNEIRVNVTYFDSQMAGSSSTGRNWTFDLMGVPDANSPYTTSLWTGITDVDNDGVPEELLDVRYVGLFDVNGDGFPDRITSSGGQLRANLWDTTTKTFVNHPGSNKVISASNVTVRTLWDVDGSGRLAVISTDASHNIYCHQLGPQTWRKNASLPPHYSQYHRTFQWDNYEPNEGTDTNADGMPDQIIRIPSALTTKGDFYGYISHAADKDYYLVDGGYSGPICLTSPQNESFTLKAYSFTDKLAPAGPDGFVWEDAGTAKVKCFYPGSLTPQRHGEYRFIIGVESQGTASPYWPYWISAAK